MLDAENRKNKNTANDGSAETADKISLLLDTDEVITVFAQMQNILLKLLTKNGFTACNTDNKYLNFQQFIWNSAEKDTALSVFSCKF